MSKQHEIQGFLKDFIRILESDAMKLKQDKSEFYSGWAFGYESAIDILKQQVEVWPWDDN